MPATTNSAYFSDVVGNGFDPLGAGYQVADDFTPTTTATALSVLCRGIYHPANSPQPPLNFNLYIYGDSGSLPNTGDIELSTAVSFTSLAAITDTGLTNSNTEIYEFIANIPATNLTAGTKYWLSVQADSTADTNDTWAWVVNTLGTRTFTQRSNAGAFNSITGDSYFAVYTTTTPEPDGIVLIGAAGTLAVRRRRRS